LTLQAAGAPFFQDHNQDHAQNQNKDYSKNKTYQQGMREGKDDQAHNRDHSKKRHFKKDEDQKAYEAAGPTRVRLERKKRNWTHSIAI